jgi:hypothetical protein
VRYLGGKFRVALELVAALPRGLLWWEPFVGGANITPHMRPVLISDARQALASLYTAVRDGYRGLAFDHAAFWSRCREYAAAGWYVAVSEYLCPVNHVLLWEKRRNLEMHGKDRAAGRRERLFRVLP